METAEQIRDRVLARFPGAEVTLIPNPGPSAQVSLLLGAACARQIAEFLRDAPGLRLDYCSNVTGIDWPERPATPAAPNAVAALADPGASVVAGVVDPGPASPRPATSNPASPAASSTPSGLLEVVYHLYSIELKLGPVVVRQRTTNRRDAVSVSSLTPVWRSCEFQEREVFDLFGVRFDGHPDLRRILMWDGFKDHPMRRDYVSPDDFEWEPTPHDQVLARAKQHFPKTEERSSEKSRS